LKSFLYYRRSFLDGGRNNWRDPNWMTQAWPLESGPLPGFCKPSFSSLYNLSLPSSSVLSLGATSASRLDYTCFQQGNPVSNGTCRHDEPSFPSALSKNNLSFISSSSRLSLTPSDGLVLNSNDISSTTPVPKPPVLSEINGLWKMNPCHSYLQPATTECNSSLLSWSLPRESVPFFESIELHNALHSGPRLNRCPEVRQEDVESSRVNTCSLLSPETKRMMEEILRAHCSVPFFEGRELHNALRSGPRLNRCPEVRQEDVESSRVNTCSLLSPETERMMEGIRAHCSSAFHGLTRARDTSSQVGERAQSPE